MARKKRRGISIGTYVITVLSMLTIFVGAILFVRISGNFDQITLNPKMLIEPFELLTQAVIDTGPEDQSAGKLPFEQPTVSPTAVSTIPPMPTESPVRTLTISAVGQITIGDELRRAARTESGVLDFGAMFDFITPLLAGADLSIATLRTGVTDNSSQVNTYRAPKELVEGMKAKGFLLLNLATDRALDYGIAGVETTRTALASAQISAAGAYLSDTERDALPIKEINGVPVGVLSYTGAISSTGKKVTSEEERQTAIRLLDIESAKEDIAELRRKGASVVIVLAHWGNRSDTKVSKETKAIANALVEAGADIILGTNPTQVQEMERRMVQAADGSVREVFIAYSLGNFLIDDSREASNITGMVLTMTLAWNKQENRLTIQDAWYMPTWIMRWKDTKGVNRYRVVPAGISSLPPDMTQTVHNNMNKAYQNVVATLGTTSATPRME